MITATQELNQWLDRRSRLFHDAMMRMAWARFQGTWQDRMRERGNVQNLIQQTLILADLRGRKRVLMEARAVSNGQFAADPPPEHPDKTPIGKGLTFVEAVEDITTREPILETASEELARQYGERHVFGLVRAAEGNVDKRIALWRTERLQKGLAEIEARGEGLVQFEEMAREIGPWTRNYADVVYRTNISNSYSNGRFAQALDPDVKDAVPALELVGIPDERERDNHKAARGFVAPADDPRWNRIRPPLGYGCRHGLNFVTRGELERRGLFKDGKVIPYLPPNFDEAHPDLGFRPGAF